MAKLYNVNSRVQQSLQQATYSAFFCLSGNKQSKLVEYCEALIRFVVDLSFPLTVWVKDGNMFPMSDFHYVREGWMYQTSRMLQEVTAYAITLSVYFNVAYFLYLVRFYKNKRTSNKPAPALAHLYDIHVSYTTGPFKLFYFCMVLRYMQCDGQGYCSKSTVLQPGPFAYFSISLLVHFIFTLFFKGSVYDWNPLTQLPGGAAHSRCVVASTVVRFAVALVFGILGGDQNELTSYCLITLCLVYHCGLALFYLHELPYHAMFMNQLHVSIYGVCFMASLSVLFRLFAGAEGEIACLGMFLVGSFLSVPVAFVAAKWRLKYAIKKPIAMLRHQTDIELRLRHELYKKINSRRLKQSTTETGSASQAQEDILREVYQSHGKQHKSSFKINSIWASYVFLFNYNKFLAMQTLRQTLKSSPFFFDIVPIQIRLRYVSECSSAEEVEAGLISYEEQQRLERYAIECMYKCLVTQARFWATLIADEYNLDKLEVLSSDINDYGESARDSLQRILLLSPKSPFFRRLYSQFLSGVVNDEAGAKRQLNRAVELESEEDSHKNLTDSNNCIIIISGERETLGQILEANNKTCEAFGVSSEDIIGRKVNMLMARPFVAGHNARLIRYIEEKAVLSTVNRSGLMAKGSDGFVFETDLQVREYANFTLDPSIAFFGALKILPFRAFCLVKKSDLVVWDLSKIYSQIFKPDIQRLAEYEHKITTDIPEFEGEIAQIEAAMEEAG
jgi:PAS domain S-box-containing protein